jgi:predicted GIY-YIG superfamily endonuclease
VKAGLVYILRCSDGSYYTGCTSNFDVRIEQHRAGQIPGYTSKRRPVTIMFVQAFPDIRDAISAERRIKGWSRRKKEALIAGDFDLLRYLSRSRSRRLDC